MCVRSPPLSTVGMVLATSKSVAVGIVMGDEKTTTSATTVMLAQPLDAVALDSSSNVATFSSETHPDWQ